MQPALHDQILHRMAPAGQADGEITPRQCVVLVELIRNVVRKPPSEMNPVRFQKSAVPLHADLQQQFEDVVVERRNDIDGVTEVVQTVYRIPASSVGFIRTLVIDLGPAPPCQPEHFQNAPERAGHSLRVRIHPQDGQVVAKREFPDTVRRNGIIPVVILFRKCQIRQYMQTAAVEPQPPGTGLPFLLPEYRISLQEMTDPAHRTVRNPHENLGRHHIPGSIGGRSPEYFRFQIMTVPDHLHLTGPAHLRTKVESVRRFLHKFQFSTRRTVVVGRKRIRRSDLQQPQ